MRTLGYVRVAAIGYIRVSTEEQAGEGYSLAAQEESLRRYAGLYELDLVDVIADAGASAKDLDRPGLIEALRRLDVGEADGLVVAKLDRLTRSVVDLGRLIERYFGESGGKALLSVGEQIDTRSAGGRLVLNVLVSVAQWEREAISERTIVALAQKRQAGEHVGTVPYGFELDSPGGRLVRDAEEAEVIARILELRERGLSFARIAAVLNAAGARTRRDYLWGKQQVKRVCDRESSAPAGDGPDD